jgi:oligoribonuclease NrnB/cAMP/cGMP phosphodiesterase (DHH superfamily)
MKHQKIRVKWNQPESWQRSVLQQVSFKWQGGGNWRKTGGRNLFTTWLTFCHSTGIVICGVCISFISTADQNSKTVKGFAVTWMDHQWWNLNLQELWSSSTSVTECKMCMATRSYISESKCRQLTCCFTSKCYFVWHKCAQISCHSLVDTNCFY